MLGHEIGHVTARHAAQQYSRSIGAELGLLAGAIFVPQTRPFTVSLEAFVGTYYDTTKNLGRVVMRAAHVQLGRAVFLIAGVAPTASFDTVEPHFTGRLTPSVR